MDFERIDPMTNTPASKAQAIDDKTYKPGLGGYDVTKQGNRPG